MVKICKKCKKVFENISIIYNNKGQKKYQCADGKFFKNSFCPVCAKIAHKEYQRKKYGKHGGLRSLYCPECGEKFVQTTVLQLYCSKGCRKKANANKRSIKDKTKK